MFGPNARALAGADAPRFHHRSPPYAALLGRVEAAFRSLAGLDARDAVLVLTGSGTLALEAAAWSLAVSVVCPHAHLEFGSRLYRLLAQHGHNDTELRQHTAVVAYETAVSHPAAAEDLAGATLVDAVSSFPYYPAPAAPVWATVSSKQIGALPVLGLVVVRAGAWRLLREADELSYLNLARYRDAQARGQPPHTPAIPLVVDLAERLEAFDAAAERRRIDARRALLAAAVPPAQIVGSGPVFTLRAGALPEAMGAALGLYRGSGGVHQAFLWSGSDVEYERLAVLLGEEVARP